MFESAASVRSQMKNEGVVAIRNLAHQRRFSLDDLLHVDSHSFRIVVAFAIDHDAMRNAFDVEYECFEITGFERRVVKNVEVLGVKRVLLTKHRGQTRGDFPNIRREHTHSRRTLQKTVEIHQESRVVPEGMV